MKTELLSIMVALLLTSCAANSTGDEAIANANDTYRFASINFYLNTNEGDGLIHVEKLQPTQVFYNATSNSLTITANLYDELTEYSLFMSSSSRTTTPNYSIDNQAYISVPVGIENGKLVFGEKKWSYSFSDIEKLPYTALKTQKIYELSGNTALSIASKVKVGRITASYTASFVGQNTGNTVTIKGKWEGGNILGGDHTENTTVVN